MADIELVIKIDEDIYKSRKQKVNNPKRMVDEIELAIANGTPLPKGHGDIIDRNKIEYMKAIYELKWGIITASECATKIKYSAPTIIEADKECKDGNDERCSKVVKKNI